MLLQTLALGSHYLPIFAKFGTRNTFRIEDLDKFPGARRPLVRFARRIIDKGHVVQKFRFIIGVLQRSIEQRPGLGFSDTGNEALDRVHNSADCVRFNLKLGSDVD